MSAGHESYRQYVPGRESSNPHGDPPEVTANLYHEDSRPDIDLEATRYLSAATHLDLRYAEAVIRTVVSPSLSALAPAAGADVVVVARWALAALRLRWWRDVALSGLLACALGVCIIAHFWLAMAIAVAFAAPVAAVEQWVRYHRVIARNMLRHRFDPSAAPTSPNPVVERRLEEIARQQVGNLVVFRGRSAFVGSGRHRSHHRMMIDLRKGSRKKSGKQGKPIPFTIPELHSAIQDDLRRMKLPNLHVVERLYVKGDHIAGDQDILPDPLFPPAASVSSAHLHGGAIHPTPDARTYVCAEMRGWKGQLVVSLFVRGLQTKDSLYIEWSFRVLSPIKRAFLDIDNYFEASTSWQIIDSARVGLVTCVPALFTAPFHLLRVVSRRSRRFIQTRRLEHAIANGYVFNYGSRISIREIAQATRGHYFLERDQQAYIILAEQALLNSIGKFLEAHRIDLELFYSQVNFFFESINKAETNIGKVEATTATFGDNAQVNNQVRPPKDAGNKGSNGKGRG